MGYLQVVQIIVWFNFSFENNNKKRKNRDKREQFEIPKRKPSWRGSS